jgi:hypothetical protein
MPVVVAILCVPREGKLVPFRVCSEYGHLTRIAADALSVGARVRFLIPLLVEQGVRPSLRTSVMFSSKTRQLGVEPAQNRHPLQSANNVPRQAVPPGSPPPKSAAQKMAPPGSPPLPRQTEKVPPPSPPQIIRDHARSVEFVRIGLLGEVCCKVPASPLSLWAHTLQGGFARVYEVKTPKGHRVACKVVTKESLKTKKAKTKVRVMREAQFLSSSDLALVLSSMLRSRFIAPLTILTLWASKSVSKMTRTST